MMENTLNLDVNPAVGCGMGHPCLNPRGRGFALGAATRE